jgi:hypothetical protein
MTSNDVAGAVVAGRGRLLSAIDAMGDGAETMPVTREGWTAQDVLAHLIHWGTQVAFGLGAAVTPPVYMSHERQRRAAAGLGDAMPTGDESNALAVGHFRGRPFDAVRAEFVQVSDSIIEQTRLRSDDEMAAVGTVPFAGPRPLWQFIAGDTFEHWAVHAEAIERARTAG